MISVEQCYFLNIADHGLNYEFVDESWYEFFVSLRLPYSSPERLAQSRASEQYCVSASPLALDMFLNEKEKLSLNVKASFE